MENRVQTLILKAFTATPHDISARDLYQQVVLSRGVDENEYRRARKALGIKSYRVGKAWWFQNPNKHPKSLEDQIEESLAPLARGVEWEDFLAAAKVALKRVRSL